MIQRLPLLSILNTSLFHAFKRGKSRDLTVELCQTSVCQCNKRIHLRGTYVCSSALLVQSHVLAQSYIHWHLKAENFALQWLKGRHTFPSANLALGAVILDGGERSGELGFLTTTKYL